MKYRPEIDGLRAFAVLPVIGFHGKLPGFSGGFIGVDVFFVISGYLITSILLADLSEGRFSLLRFYERRARRILPALYFVMLLCIPFALIWMLPGELKVFGHNTIAVGLFASNILFWRTTNYFSPRADENPLLHTWSLAVEEQFYIFFPLGLWLFWRMGWRASIAAISVTALVSLGLSEWGWRNSSVANFFLLPTRAWELMAGSLCAVALNNRDAWNTAWLSLMGFGMIIVAMVVFDERTPFPSLYGLLPVIGVVFIILFAGPQTLVGRVLAVKPIVGIGLISYSAYLWHQPLFAFARLRVEGHPSAILVCVLVVVSLVLAAFSWKFVEQPFRQSSGAIKSRNGVFLASGCGMMGFILLGLALHASNGWVTRYAVEDRALVSIDYAKAGEYVLTRFEAHLLKPFADNGKNNILIIGDSYGQDMVNVVYEVDLQDNVNISTHLIRADCGNLLLERNLSDLRQEKDRRSCDRDAGYDTQKLNPLFEKADFILLVSSWRDWVVPFIEESVSNISARTDAEIIVVGRKSFGRLHPADILKYPFEMRSALRSPVSIRHLEINETMAGQNVTYLNMHKILCDGRDGCPIMSEKSELLSHDGSHLTRVGAIFVGNSLIEKSVLFRRIFAVSER